MGAALLAAKKGMDVFVSDSGMLKPAHKATLQHYAIPFEEGGHCMNNFTNALCCVKSPGIPNSSPVIRYFEEKSIPVISEIEFAYRHYKGIIIAITGSNGKTTTTHLSYFILKKAGLKVGMAGNVGKSFARLLAEEENYTHVVLEISSFQLDNIVSFAPHIAIILNITPDHLDRYERNFELYAQAKWKITRNQTSRDYLIYNKDDQVIKELMQRYPSAACSIPFSLREELPVGGYLKSNAIIINDNHKNQFSMSIYDLALTGRHNVYNSLAASIMARALEIRKEVIRESLHDFRGVEHRLEKVTTVSGIEFINDSKATNVNSTWYALESMTKPVIWIAGGVDKGNDYSELFELAKTKVKALICLGKDNNKLIKAFKNIVPVIHEAASMEEAVKKAYYSASKGDVVLLSPACASFDLFENYEHRGLLFKKAVREL